MRVLWLQHVPFEGLGSIEKWCRDRNAAVSATRLFDGQPPPSHDDYDALIVMGGPMGVYEDAEFPWLATEKRFIAEAIAARKRTLGICLGAQLISSVLGGKVTKNREKEIGWFPIQWTDAAQAHPVFAAIPREAEVFHWHGDTFSIPPGAVALARSEGCDNQAFLFGSHVLGLQFHLETTRESAAALLANCAADLKPGRFIQQPALILKDHARFERINTMMSILLDRFLAV